MQFIILIFINSSSTISRISSSSITATGLN